MDALYTYPEYFKEIVAILAKKSWLVHNFLDVNDSDLYNFLNYVYNKDTNGVTYTICLDVNVYQFILNSVKKEASKPEYQAAIALVAFCQLSKIELDPSIAAYEKLNYSNDDELLNEITSDLELFKKIDNTNYDQLVRYVLSDISQIQPTNDHHIDHSEIQMRLTKYRKLRNWDSLYLIILFIVHTSLDEEMTRKDKLKFVIEWMITDFRLSLVCIIYAIVFFSNKPIKRMMKFKRANITTQKCRALSNMAWDLYSLNMYFKKWTEKDSSNEFLYASDDNAFRKLLRLSIDVQLSGNLEPLGDYVDSSDLKYLDKITSSPSEDFERVFNSEEYTPEYRQSLIDSYSEKLGLLA